jgi:hypothetical protein
MKKKIPVFIPLILACLVVFCMADDCEPPPEQMVRIMNNSSISVYVVVSSDKETDSNLLAPNNGTSAGIKDSLTFSATVRPASNDWLDSAERTRDILLTQLFERDARTNPERAAAIKKGLKDLEADMATIKAGLEKKSCTGVAIKGKKGSVTISDGDKPNSVNISCSSSEE